MTGQPAAVVPWGFDGNGVPTSIQLVGRPFDEATLLSLGAQIEKARPWAQRRPTVSYVQTHTASVRVCRRHAVPQRYLAHARDRYGIASAIAM